MINNIINPYKEFKEYIKDAFNNIKVTEEKYKELFDKIELINRTFYELIEFLNNSKDWFIILFVLRAHSSFLSAAILSTSTQLPDSYGSMRSIIENTLYGFYIWKHKEYSLTWLIRHKDENTRKDVRDLFKYNLLIAELKKTNKKYGEIFDYFYKDTIDYGAHPNVASILTNMDQIKSGDKMIQSLKYFNPDPVFLESTLKQLFKIGFFSLKIFCIVWYKRLKIAGFIDKIENIEKEV
jgi:hypothetical protein